MVTNLNYLLKNDADPALWINELMKDGTPVDEMIEIIKKFCESKGIPFVVNDNMPYVWVDTLMRAPHNLSINNAIDEVDRACSKYHIKFDANKKLTEYMNRYVQPSES